MDGNDEHFALLTTNLSHPLQNRGFDLSNEQAMMLGCDHYFEKNSMIKLNIFQINGVWQLGRPH